jgi:hypothetical protein
MRTGGRILVDIADKAPGSGSTKDIISKHVSESTQNLVRKLRGGGKRRAALPSSRRAKKRKVAAKKKKTPVRRLALKRRRPAPDIVINKRDIFS